MSTVVTISRATLHRVGEEKAERVLKALDERDLTVAWAARQIGESRQVVWNWLKGIKSPQDPEAFDRLLDAIEGTVVRDGRMVHTKGEPTVQVPLSGVGAAGTWTVAEGRETVNLPLQLASEGYHAVLIDGTSMLPHILPGDVAVFRKWAVPKIGYVNACAKDGQIVIKLVQQEGGRLVLRSFNPSEPEASAEGCIALGFLVGVYRDDGVETMHRHNHGGLRFE
jgi:SOS-response transcriptional repressor LexA